MEQFEGMVVLVAKAGIVGGIIVPIVEALKSMTTWINGWRTLVPVILLAGGFTWFDVSRVTPPDYAAGIVEFFLIVATSIGVNLKIAKASTGELPGLKVNKPGNGQ